METRQIKIGVISDTHFRSLSEGHTLIAELLEDEFADVDAIFHAGDMIHPDISILFSDVPFYAVRGNNDPPVTGVPQYRVIELSGYRIGLIHGWGNYDDMEHRMIEFFSDTRLDCLIYGHTHRPVCHEVGDMLVLNPGSAADRRHAPWHSVALLYIDDNIRGEIINIDANRQIV